MEKLQNGENTNTNAGEMKNNVPFGETKGTLLIEKTQIRDTKFQLIRSEDRGYSIGIAGQRISAWYKTEQDALNDNHLGDNGNDINWDFLMGVILVLMENTLTMKKIEDREELERQIQKGIQIADEIAKKSNNNNN